MTISPSEYHNGVEVVFVDRHLWVYPSPDSNRLTSIIHDTEQDQFFANEGSMYLTSAYRNPEGLLLAILAHIESNLDSILTIHHNY